MVQDILLDRVSVVYNCQESSPRVFAITFIAMKTRGCTAESSHFGNNYGHVSGVSFKLPKDSYTKATI